MNNCQIEFAPNRTGDLSDDIHKANPFALTREFDPIGFPNSNIFVEQGNVHPAWLSASHTITGSDNMTNAGATSAVKKSTIYSHSQNETNSPIMITSW